MCRGSSFDALRKEPAFEAEICQEGSAPTFNDKFSSGRNLWTPEIREKCMKKLRSHMDDLEINKGEFINTVEVGLCDNMTASEFAEYSSQVAESLNTKHPHYGILSVRIVLGEVYDNTLDRFSDRIWYIRMNSSLICDEFYNIVIDNRVSG